jgi:hypothetical protein
MTTNIKIKIISYTCYAIAVLFLLKAIAPITIIERIIAILFTLVWYQAGTGMIKRKNYARKFIIVLMSLFLIGTLAVVFDSIIMPLIDPTIKYVGAGRWITLMLCFVPIFVIWSLMRKDIQNEFLSTPKSGNNSNNANTG